MSSGAIVPLSRSHLLRSFELAPLHPQPIRWATNPHVEESLLNRRPGKYTWRYQLAYAFQLLWHPHPFGVTISTYAHSPAMYAHTSLHECTHIPCPRGHYVPGMPCLQPLLCCSFVQRPSDARPTLIRRSCDVRPALIQRSFDAHPMLVDARQKLLQSSSNARPITARHLSNAIPTPSAYSSDARSSHARLMLV